MTEKYILPTFDYYGKRVEIKNQTAMLFALTGTCTDRDFHPKKAWTFDSLESKLETVSSRKKLEEFIAGWANEILSAHERTGCIVRPQITIATQDYVFRV
jgi:hypothetical protein